MTAHGGGGGGGGGLTSFQQESQARIMSAQQQLSAHWPAEASATFMQATMQAEHRDQAAMRMAKPANYYG
jgi:hypothetical protein